jgi:hypothetical protein
LTGTRNFDPGLRSIRAVGSGSDDDWLAGGGGRPETGGARQEAAAELAGDGQIGHPST